MASLLRKDLSSVSSLFLSSRSFHNNLSIFAPLLQFSTQIQQKDDLPFMAQYLISSFGFSKDRALRVSNQQNLVPIKNADRPESVVRYLMAIGLTDIQINNAVSKAPRILSLSVRKTLEPCRHEIIAGGFTEETLHQLIRFNPMALTLKNLISRLQFWRNFVGNNEEIFLKLIENHRLINTDINMKVIPRIDLLREYGLSDKQMVRMLSTVNYFLQDLDSIKSNMEKIEKLGFARGSKMFLEGLTAISCLKKDTYDRKVTFFNMTYGWSDEDFNLALKRYPKVVNKSEEKITSTMDFLIRKVGLNPRSIAMRPTLLGFSLERRLIPRHRVLTVLKSKGLKNKLSFQSASCLSEKRFIEKYILPYKEELPDLGEAYAAACDGKLHLS